MFKFAVKLGSFCILLTSPAVAASGVSFGGPVGATDLDNAYLPPVPGVYLGITHGNSWADTLYGNNGKLGQALNFGSIEALYGMYVYSFKLFSGTVASGVQALYFDDTLVKLSLYHLPRQDVTGWGDLYVDFINWSTYIGPLFGEGNPTRSSRELAPYELTVKAEYSMIFPTGHYNYRINVNATGGTYYFIPNISATYLTQPNLIGEGVQLDLHAFYNRQLSIPHLDYDSGDVIDIDFAAAERMGRWTAGVAGSYAFQLQDDRSGPEHVIVNGNGNHFESLFIGPVVGFYIPSWRTSIKFKYLNPIVSRNTLNFSQAFANAFVAF